MDPVEEEHQARRAKEQAQRHVVPVSQTSFGHISTNSSTIPTVLNPA